MPETIVRATLPEMGESVTEGSIVEWRVKVGQWIDEGATLVDVTTDKVDVEVPAPASGVVTALSGDEGATVGVGAVLAEIDTSAPKPEGAGTASPAAASNGGTAAHADAAGNGSAAATAGQSIAPGNPARLPDGPPTSEPVDASGRISHRAQRLAEREHLDLSRVKGTGPDGLVLLEDAVRAAKSPAAPRANGAAPGPATAPPQPPVVANSTAVPLRGPAAALVGYMEQSLTIPTATSFRTFGVATLEARRAELNAALKNARRPEKVSFTHVIAFALVQAAREMPAMVASFRREGATLSRIDGPVNLGLAVDSERKDGTRFLVVPVIKNAAALDFAGFRAAYEALVAKARDGKLTADELTGATFTLTNPGGIGTSASVPRLMGGQGAIIAAGAIGYPPGFTNVPDATMRQLGIEKTMTLTSTYDHRVIQGAQSGEYLRRVEQLLAGADGFYERLFTTFALPAPSAVVRDVPASRAPGATPVAVTELAPAAPRQFEDYSNEMLRAVAAGMAILSAYRRHGHLAATLDPLGTQPAGDPALDVQTYNLTPAVMGAVPASVLRTKLPGDTLADILPRLRETYSSTIAYEVEHIANIEQREWLRDYIESGRHRVPLSRERARNVLQRLTKVETFERYLRKAFIGQKTFSIEGVDMMVPLLEELITLFADDGIATTVMGMAHRGRLATIAHVVNRPYEEILAEFEAADLRGEGEEDATGDVKYHHGSVGTYQTLDGREIAVALANNPSHLEAVDGVVEGRTRALQTGHDTPVATLDTRRAAPVLVHGDAAFSAQGVVAEVLNLAALAGYATGGTMHVIANNQIGFTTDPSDARSTRYASDLAKGFDVPIVHVNADDVEGCMAAVHLAVDFRRRFGHDAIIDIIGYRRFGHNETDEPAYTQPELYERIKTHPTVRELYAQQLIARGEISTDEVNAMMAAATARLNEAHQRVKSGQWNGAAARPPAAAGIASAAPTPVTKERLIAWSEALSSVPAGFTVHPKLARQLERRNAAFLSDGDVDWGLAEALAFASLLADRTPIRLTGQDSERGTFSHRHMMLHDPKTGEAYAPIQHLPGSKASFELYNSPLSEYACLGFEYGYSVELPGALVLWEAQFGDFMNGAQIIIDQFIAAGHAKWGENSRLVLLLPHGYEGAGPEHSSARIERFLQLSAEGNVRVANCSNASQYYHLLRSQAKSARPAPLIVFTPKSLLRMRAAGGNVDELATGTFQPVIDDARFAQNREAVERLLLCSGKIYYDLIGNEAYERLRKTAIARIELLSPLPAEEMAAVFASYPNLREVLWVQEEPKNMGARSHVRRLVDHLPAGVEDIGYIGRSYRASPSEGYGGAHAMEQERIVREALSE